MSHYLSKRKNWQKESSKTDTREKKYIKESLQIICDKYKGEFKVLNNLRIKFDGYDKMSYEAIMDGGLQHIKTGNIFYIESKGSQKGKGNAHIERACRWLPTSGETRILKEKMGVKYIPVAVTLTEGLVNESIDAKRKKRQAFNQFYGYEDFLLFWQDYDHKIFENWVEKVILPRLRGDIIDD